jgi:cytochrome oxidase Cu insertion factor (SCO1/SenC/PrrC family)
MSNPTRRRPTRKHPRGRNVAAVLALVALCLVSSQAAPAPAQTTRAPKRAAPKAPAAAAKASPANEAGLYSCPMHPEVTSKTAGGRCPKCGMNLVKSEPAAASKPSEPAAANAAANTTAAGAAEPVRITETAVLDQDGRRLDFYKDLVKGKTVAVNFIFTTCTTVCPPLTATFRRVQQMLGERAGRDVSLISVSVDPVTDTPERLKAFAEKFKAGPGWTFVTGGKPEVGALLKALGAATADKNDHTPMVLVGNEPAGAWTRTYGLAHTSQLVQIINDTMVGKTTTTAEESN